MNTVIDCLENTFNHLKENNQLFKYAFIDQKKKLTYFDLFTKSRFLASIILEKTKRDDVVCILERRGVDMCIALLAAIYAGTPYVVLDCEQPISRIEKIIEIVNPTFLIYDTDNYESSNSIKTYFKDIYNIDNLHNEEKSSLNYINHNIVASDPLYILFTSGSTGNPKGTVITHKNVICYIKWFTKCFNINENTIFASQTPFYFSMSVSDFYSTIFNFATMVIIPKQYFSFPVKVIEMMNMYNVNTIYWVPSAYRIMSDVKILDYIKPTSLTTALFAGEVMPVKILNDWLKHLPNVMYANLFGPTETTDICTYYKVNRSFKLEESLPIGKPCESIEVFLINENNCIVEGENIGELYVKGDFVAQGYYNNLEKTQECFVQNPLHNNYIDIVYKTGDLCCYNEFHELMYVSRKDLQIKHMGYRIELGEIETILNSMLIIKSSFCLYDKDNDEIICLYEGGNEEEIVQYLSLKLPKYMMPNKYIKLPYINLNQNGKIDRNYYKKLYIEK